RDVSARQPAAPTPTSPPAVQPPGLLAQMAHEVNHVLAISENCESLLAASPGTEQRRLAETFGRIRRHLASTVEAVVREADKRTPRRDPFLLPDVIADVVGLFAPAALRKGVDLQSEIAPDVP